MKLSKSQAKELSEIMGVKYTHHDENVCYKDHGDVNPMIYFYQGMSPYTFKLDNVTGEVSDMLSKYLNLMAKIVLKLKENGEDISELEQSIQDYDSWNEKQKKIIEYLNSNNLLEIKE